MQYDAIAVAATLGLAFGQTAAEPSTFMGRGSGCAEEAAPSARAGEDRPSFSLMQRLVEQGLPRCALRHLAREIVEDPERAAALEHRIVPRTTLARRGEDGLLTPEESEKTERLARLYVQAARALGDPADAREFLARPHPELEGRAPWEAGLTVLGARRVEAILNGFEHGLPV